MDRKYFRTFCMKSGYGYALDVDAYIRDYPKRNYSMEDARNVYIRANSGRDSNEKFDLIGNAMTTRKFHNIAHKDETGLPTSED